MGRSGEDKLRVEVSSVRKEKVGLCKMTLGIFFDIKILVRRGPREEDCRFEVGERTIPIWDGEGRDPGMCVR